MEQQVGRNQEELKVEGKKGEQEGVLAIFNTLNNQIANNHQSLYSKLVKVFLKKYSQQEREKIEQLLEAWNTYDVDLLIQNEEFVGQEVIHFYKQTDILSARTYSKLLQFLKAKRTNRDDSEQDKKWEPLRKICWQNQIQFSLDRFFWSRKFIKKSGISYSKHGFQREEIESVQDNSQAKMVADWIATCQVPLLQKILQFMKEAHFFVLQGPVENIFMQKLQRISKKDQKELFIRSISCECYEDAKVLHTRQFKSGGHQQEALQAVRKNLFNYFFYKDGGHKPHSINALHSKFQNYKYLENRHDYIQWMFPNHYGSAFNSKSFQLTYLESSLFQQDAEIGLGMLFSIYLFFDFMGIRLHLPTLKLSVCSRERLQAVILVNYHNHLRIMRVLACLSVTGFRPIALSLIDLLDRLTAPSEFLEAQRHQFESSWQIYGDKVEGGAKKTAKDMCFLEEQNFPKNHHILSLLITTFKQENSLQEQEEKIIQDFA